MESSLAVRRADGASTPSAKLSPEGDLEQNVEAPITKRRRSWVIALCVGEGRHRLPGPPRIYSTVIRQQPTALHAPVRS